MPGILYSQKQANVWFFGSRAGLTFNTSDGHPQGLVDGMLNSVEGCASASDKSGNILFYTNGQTVWNNHHEVMLNGSDLLGHQSSTQSALIVQSPSDSFTYYLFTTDAKGEQLRLMYSTVDMRLDSGRGAVVEKNVFLANNVCEKLTAALHKNRRDYWIIVHAWDSDVFYSFLLNDKGVNPEPVESLSGLDHTGNIGNRIGYMKTSPDGTGLALGVYLRPGFELYDFDKETGIVSNALELNWSGFNNSYGVEFSNDSKKLYITAYNDTSKIFQYDLSVPRNQISKTSVLLDSRKAFIGALQSGPDGRIYVAVDDSMISVINYPNKKGLDCGYRYKAIDLKGRICRSGLPNFLPSYFKSSEILNLPDSIITCQGDNIELSAPDLPEAVYVWWFNNYKLSLFPSCELKSLQPGNTGYYVVVMSVDGKTYTDSTYVLVHSRPVINIRPSNNINVDTGKPVTVRLDGSFPIIRWFDGSLLDSVVINQAGNYFVEVTDSNGCREKAVFNITYHTKDFSGVDDFDLGRAVVGDSVSIGFSNHVVSRSDIELLSVSVLNHKNIFEITTMPPLPALIRPDSQVRYTVRFKPGDVRDYIDTAVLRYKYTDSPNQYETRFPLKGSGFATLVFFVPDTSGKAGEYNYRLPLYCRLKCNRSDFVDTINFNSGLDIDAAMLLPDPNQGPGVTETSVSSGRRYFEIRGYDAVIKPGISTLNEITGRLFLSQNVVSDILFDKVECTNPNYTIEYETGRLEIKGICQPKLGTIKSFQRLNATITPVPAADHALVNVDGVSEGSEILMEIYSSAAVLVKSLSISCPAGRPIVLALGDVPTGIYHLSVKSGSERIFLQLLVVK